MRSVFRNSTLSQHLFPGSCFPAPSPASPKPSGVIFFQTHPSEGVYCRTRNFLWTLVWFKIPSHDKSCEAPARPVPHLRTETSLDQNSCIYVLYYTYDFIFIKKQIDKARSKEKTYMVVIAKRDWKLKQRDLHATQTLGCTGNPVFRRFVWKFLVYNRLRKKCRLRNFLFQLLWQLLFQFLYPNGTAVCVHTRDRPGTKTEIVKIIVKVNCEDDTFSTIGCVRLGTNNCSEKTNWKLLLPGKVNHDFQTFSRSDKYHEILRRRPPNKSWKQVSSLGNIHDSGGKGEEFLLQNQETTVYTGPRPRIPHGTARAPHVRLFGQFTTQPYVWYGILGTSSNHTFTTRAPYVWLCGEFTSQPHV
jgi:hypothetical protein